MKPYSVRNRVTPGTQVRIAVLQVLARRYKVSNPGSKVQVSMIWPIVMEVLFSFVLRYFSKLFGLYSVAL